MEDLQDTRVQSVKVWQRFRQIHSGKHPRMQRRRTSIALHERATYDKQPRRIALIEDCAGDGMTCRLPSVEYSAFSLTGAVSFPIEVTAVGLLWVGQHIVAAISVIPIDSCCTMAFKRDSRLVVIVRIVSVVPIC